MQMDTIREGTIGFLIEKMDRPIEKTISRYVRNNGITSFRVYSLEKPRQNGSQTQINYMDMNNQYLQVLGLAFQLLDRAESDLDATAAQLSDIFQLDLNWLTRRLLLNDLFVREARLILAEDKVRQLQGINEVMIFIRGSELLEGKNNLVRCRDFKDFFRPVKMYWDLIRAVLANIEIKPKKTADGKIICVTYPGYFKLIEDSLKMINNQWGALLAIKDLYAPERRKKVNAEGYEYLRTKAKFNVGILPDYIVKYRLIKKLRKYPKVFQSRLIDIMIRKAGAEYIAKYHRPKLILAKNEYEVFENLEYAVFKKNNVKYVHYMHGDKIFDVYEAYAESDTFLVWGEYYQELLNKLRCRSRIAVVGNQKMEKMASSAAGQVKQLKQIRNSYGKIISVYMQSSNGPHDCVRQEKMLNAVINAARQQNGVFLIIKHHPLEFQHKTPDYERIIAPIKERVLRVKGEEIDLAETIMAADLIITPSSVVGLEAILLEKLVLFVNLSSIPGLVIYPEHNLAQEVTREEEIEPMVAKLLLEGENIRQGIDFPYARRYWANGLKGNSADLFYKEIEKVLNDQQ